MPTLSDIVLACLRGETDLESAASLVMLMGMNGSFDSSELEEITEEVGLSTDDLAPGESLAAFFAWLLVEHVDGLKLKIGIALNFARSLLFQSMTQEALDVSETAVAWCKELADTRALAVALSFQANVHAFAGNDNEELILRLRCAVIAREIGDVRMEALEEVCVGSLLDDTDPRMAAEHLSRGLELARMAGLHDCEALALVILAQVADPTNRGIRVQHLGQASSAALAARTRSSELVNAVRRAVNMQFELGVDEHLGELLELGLALAQERGDEATAGHYLGNLGAYLTRQGDYHTAEEKLLEARRIAVATGDSEGIAIADTNLEQIRPHLRRTAVPATADASPENDATVDQAVAVTEELERLAAEVAVGTSPLEAASSRLPPRSPNPSVMTWVASRVSDRAEDPSLSGRQTYALLALAAQYVPDDIEPMAAVRLFSLWGAYCRSAGAVDDAVAAHSRALRIARAHPGTLGSTLISTLTNLATVLRQQGRTAEAIDHYKEALARARSEDSPEALILVLVNAATAFDDQGRYDEARALNEEALPILTAGLPDTGAALSICLLNYGGELLRLGDIDTADQHLGRALEVTRRYGGPRHEGPVLGTLGKLREQQHRYPEAMEYYARALELAEQTGDLWNAGNWCRDLGQVLLRLGLTVEATGVFEDALDYARRVHDVRAEAVCQQGLARANSFQHPEESIATLRSVWASHGQGPEQSFAAQVAIALAEAHVDLSIDSQHRVEAIIRDDPLPRRPGVTNRAALEEAEYWLDTAESLLQGAGDQTPVYGEVVTLRARILQLQGNPSAALEELASLGGDNPQVSGLVADIYLHDLQDFSTARRYVDVAIAAREQLLDDFRLPLARMALRQHSLYLTGMECALLSGDLDGAYGYAERGKNAEGRRSLRFRHGAELTVPTLAAMREAARELGNGAVVEFVPGGSGTQVFVMAPGLDESASTFEIEGFGLPQIMSLFVRVSTAYERMKSPLAAFDDTPLVQWREAVDDACARLGRELLGPVHERLRHLAPDTVVFVPHSGLHGLPLHACPLPDGGVWADAYTVSYSPSGTLLAHNLAPVSGGEGGFVGFADPCDDLPCGRVEVAVARDGFRDGRVFEGAEASRRRLFETLRSAGWIHLACHGSQIFGDDAESHLRMSPGARGDDGYVSLADIQRDVVMTPGSTVFLSACETGAMTPHLADELGSLASGFLFAGASSVISTYWRVRDASALLFSDLFYAARRRRDASLAHCLDTAARTLRTMSEQEAYARLTGLLDTYDEVDDKRRRRVLAPFLNARDDHRPFTSPVDWAAFFLTGRP